MVEIHHAPVWLLPAIRWTARVWGAAAALVVLAFFIEHLAWLRGGQLPPSVVLVALGCHLLLLIGLVIAWRWEVMGASLTLAGVAGFTLAVGGGWRLLPTVCAIAMPAILWLCVGWLEGRRTSLARGTS
jgi:hypothetical protein